MPKMIATVRVLPANKVREDDRFIEIHCANRIVRLLAMIAVMEANHVYWWDKPAAANQLLKALSRWPPTIWMPNGIGTVDKVLKDAMGKLNAIPNVEVVIVRCDMPAAAYP